VTSHSPGTGLRPFSLVDHPRATRVRLARRVHRLAIHVAMAEDQPFEPVSDLAIRTYKRGHQYLTVVKYW
jgi:hypothetical protein